MRVCKVCVRWSFYYFIWFVLPLGIYRYKWKCERNVFLSSQTNTWSLGIISKFDNKWKRLASSKMIRYFFCFFCKRVEFAFATKTKQSNTNAIWRSMTTYTDRQTNGLTEKPQARIPQMNVCRSYCCRLMSAKICVCELCGMFDQIHWRFSWIRDQFFYIITQAACPLPNILHPTVKSQPLICTPIRVLHYFGSLHIICIRFVFIDRAICIRIFILRKVNCSKWC